MINPAYVLQSTTPGTPPYPITSLSLRLGRAPDCGIVLSDDAVSWQHATAREVNGEVVITDENSTNGVFVDERKIPAGVPYPLHPGQTLRIGATQFSLVLAAPPMAEPPIAEYEKTQTRLSPWLWLVGGLIVVALALVLLLTLLSTVSAPVTPPPALTPTATSTLQPTSTFTPIPIATATPTRLASPSVAASPVASSGQAIAAEMEAARTVLNQYGGQIDQAGSAGANLNCAAIVANYNLMQAAHGRALSPTPEQQALVDNYTQSLSRFLSGARDLTEACRSALSGSSTSANITGQQIGSARTAVADAVSVLDQIILQIKSLP